MSRKKTSPTKRTATKPAANLAPAGPGRLPLWQTVLLVVCFVGAGLAAYSNTFSVPFIFDGPAAITQNPNVQSLWTSMDVPDQTTVGGRPVIGLSLGINYQISEYEVWSYHAFNLAVHVLAALTLVGIVRRTLLTEPLAGRFAGAATPLAAACGLLWMLHPLQTQAVTYTIQRAESMVGLFYLLTLYLVIRAATSPHKLAWSVAAIAACAVGMATKEVMATAPLVILLYDRTFLAGSFHEALKRRPLHAGLWATLAILIALMLPGPRSASAGLGLETTPLQYALSECAVIVQCYLKLAIWPYPQAIDYAWPISTRPQDFLFGLIVLAVLLGATGWAMFSRRRGLRAAGFLGAWFFLILAPTSSFVPLLDAAFEHRMYLSLAAALIGLVAGAYLLGRRLKLGPWIGAGAVLLAATLGVLTHHRNRDYRSDEAIWSQCATARPGNARARANMAVTCVQLGRRDEALKWFEKALELKPLVAEYRHRYGETLTQVGRIEEAIIQIERAAKIKPDDWKIRRDLGEALCLDGQYEAAIEHLRVAVKTDPKDPKTQYFLGAALGATGKPAEGITHLQRAAELSPGRAQVHATLADALAKNGDFDQAVASQEHAVRLLERAPAVSDELLDQMRQRLDSYRTGKPWHEEEK